MSTNVADIDAYRKLQEHLDKFPVGFPPTRSGIEIRLLKHIFTPKEAQIATKLSLSYDSVQAIHGRAKELGMTIEELEQTLDKMVSKGAINFRKEDSRKLYANAVLVVGMYEYQVKRLTPEFHKDFIQYGIEAFGRELLGPRIPQLRTVPLEISITPTHYVPRYEDLRKIVQDAEGPIMVTECICRKGSSMIGRPCKKTSRKETCIGLAGNLPRLYVGQGWGREITREECLEILQKNEEEGLVLQAMNEEHPEGICSCCGCCCAMLVGLNMSPAPVKFVSSNYYAQVDSEVCAGCGTCVERCQMNAVKVIEDVAKVDLNRCIGCGVCVPTCEAKAIHLVKKEQQVAPPKTLDELFTRIMNKKIERRQKILQAKLTEQKG